MRVDNNQPYVYIQRGRALVALALKVSDILTDQVALGTREGLAEALDALEGQVRFLRAQAEDRMTEEGYAVGAVTPGA